MYQQFNDKVYLIQEEPRGPSMLVEIPITANGLSNVQFPDVPELRNQIDQKIIIKAIRVIPPAVLSNAPLTGNAVAPLTETVKQTLILYSQGWEKGKNIPVNTLIDTFIEGTGTPWKNRSTQLANWENLDWNKSQVKFANGTVSAGAPYSLLVEVEYVKLNKDGEEIVGPS